MIHLIGLKKNDMRIEKGKLIKVDEIDFEDLRSYVGGGVAEMLLELDRKRVLDKGGRSFECELCIRLSSEMRGFSLIGFWTVDEPVQPVVSVANRDLEKAIRTFIKKYY